MVKAEKASTTETLVRFPEKTKKFITIFNYSKLNTQHKSNPNWKDTTKHSPETKNSQNNVTTSKKDVANK